MPFESSINTNVLVFVLLPSDSHLKLILPRYLHEHDPAIPSKHLLYMDLCIVTCRFFDDLHPYALVQFVPCIVIPIMAILLPPMYTHSTYWLWAAGLYISSSGLFCLLNLLVFCAILSNI